MPGAGSLHQRVLRLADASSLGADAARRRASGKILLIWGGSGETYGCPRIHAELQAAGERVSRKRVARLMKDLGIQGVTRRRFKTATTKKDAKARPAPDLVNRNFSAEGPDQLWVANITQVPTWAGWLYLAVVLDVWSRRIVGWAIAPRMPAELVGDALAMAISCRQPKGQVIHHSDSECLRAGSLRWPDSNTDRHYTRSMQGRPRPPLGGLTRTPTDRDVIPWTRRPRRGNRLRLRPRPTS